VLVVLIGQELPHHATSHDQTTPVLGGTRSFDNGNISEEHHACAAEESQVEGPELIPLELVV
jgi:hypothetical protein